MVRGDGGRRQPRGGAREGRRRIPSLRHPAGRARRGGVPAGGGRDAGPATRGHPQPRRPRVPRPLGRRAAGDGGGGARHDGGHCRGRARGEPVRAGGQRRRHAARTSFPRRGRGHLHGVPSRQLRVPRSHDGGPRRRLARRLRAHRARHRGEHAGSRSPRARLRIEDARRRRRAWVHADARPRRGLSHAARDARGRADCISSSSGSRRSTPPYASRPAARGTDRETASACCPTTRASSRISSTPCIWSRATPSSTRCPSPRGARFSSRMRPAMRPWLRRRDTT